MVPTLARTLGLKGHRPVVGTRDDKDVLYAFAAVDCVTGRLHARTLGTSAALLRSRRLAGRREGVAKTRRLQRAFAAHLRQLGRAYPPGRRRRPVTVVTDNAPWHRGGPVDAALADHPHLELYRLPPYSPELNAAERLWKPLRWRATHNRLFDALADLAAAARAGLRYFQRVPARILSLIGSAYSKPTGPAGP